MDDTELNAKDLARMLSFARIVVGLAAWIAPRRFAKAWTGEEVTGVAGTMAMRGLGIRDFALGAGTLLAMEAGGPARRWIEAAALADASDAASSLLAWGKLSWPRRIMSLAPAVTACYLGVQIADQVDY